jgi:predicted membrane channel-forming protein YqfA (hemolysin III family)
MLATDWGMGDVIWTMVAIMFWITAIWIFIMVFADIFRRDDIGGGAKAAWLILIFVVPFFGALIYLIARPRAGSTEGAVREGSYSATNPMP